MLILQSAQRKPVTRQGSRGSMLTELQADPTAPGVPTGTSRRRLLNLAERLARVQALGDEYARVCFSPELEARVRSLTV